MANSYPMVDQIHTEWCWAAVGISIELYFSPGSPLKQCELAQAILKKDGCCDERLPSTLNVPAQLEDVLSYLDALQQTMVRPLAFSDIYTQIVGKCLPICVEIQWFGLVPTGHYVVVCGCPVTVSGEPWVDIADPFYGFSTIPYDQFVNSYLNAGEWAYTFLVKQP
jgi:hypothetical protein